MSGVSRPVFFFDRRSRQILASGRREELAKLRFARTVFFFSRLRSELRERRDVQLSWSAGAVEGFTRGRGGHGAESLAEVTEVRRSAPWEAARRERSGARGRRCRAAAGRLPVLRDAQKDRVTIAYRAKRGNPLSRVSLPALLRKRTRGQLLASGRREELAKLRFARTVFFFLRSRSERRSLAALRSRNARRVAVSCIIARPTLMASASGALARSPRSPAAGHGEEAPAGRAEREAPFGRSRPM